VSEWTSLKGVDLFKKRVCILHLGLVAAVTISLSVQIDQLASRVLAKATVRAVPNVTEYRWRLDTSKMALIVVTAGFLLPLAASASGGLANLFTSRQERATSFMAANIDAASGGGAPFGEGKGHSLGFIVFVSCAFLRPAINMVRQGDQILGRMVGVLRARRWHNRRDRQWWSRRGGAPRGLEVM